MSNSPFFFCRYRRAASGGFTLVELLVVIAIIGLLASVAYPAITGALNNAKHNVAMQNARSLGLAMFQSAIDPNNATGNFPVGTTSSDDAFAALIGGKYLSNASILYIAGGPQTPITTNVDTTVSANLYGHVSWDIMVNPGTGGAPTGLSTNASDDTPLVYSTGNIVAALSAGANPVPMNKTANPFGTDGMAVCYKGQSSKFIKSSVTNNNYSVNLTPPSYNDAAYTPQVAK